MELFKSEYQLFKPQIFWVVGSHKEISKHRISGYRKLKNDWYIKVFTNVLGRKNQWTWQKIKPSHVSKDKSWAMRMAVNKTISDLKRDIEREEEKIEKSNNYIIRLNSFIEKANKDDIEVSTQVKKYFNSMIRF